MRSQHTWQHMPPPQSVSSRRPSSAFVHYPLGGCTQARRLARCSVPYTPTLQKHPSSRHSSDSCISLSYSTSCRSPGFSPQPSAPRHMQTLSARRSVPRSGRPSPRPPGSSSHTGALQFVAIRRLEAANRRKLVCPSIESRAAECGASMWEKAASCWDRVVLKVAGKARSHHAEARVVELCKALEKLEGEDSAIVWALPQLIESGFEHG